MNLQKNILYALTLLFMLVVSGCAYKIEIRQGNDALLENMDQLQIGMHKEEVRQLLASPFTSHLFSSNSWFYTYQQRDAGFVGEMRLRSVELVFDDGGILREINTLHDDYGEDN